MNPLLRPYAILIGPAMVGLGAFVITLTWNPTLLDGPSLESEAAPVLIFGVALIAIGLLVTASGVSYLWSSSKARRAAEKSGRHPWMKRLDWCEFRVSAEPRHWYLVVVLVMPLFFFLLEDDPIGRFLVLPIIAVVYIGICAMALRNTLSWILHGPPVLHLSQLPVLRGQTMRAEIRLMHAMRKPGPAKCVLTCVREPFQRYHRPPFMREAPIYQARFDATPCKSEEGYYFIPVEVEIPTKFPPRGEGRQPDYAWALHIRTGLPVSGLWSEFDLPVFDADEEDVSLSPEAQAAEVSR